MSIFSKALIGSAGLAMSLAAAAPAAAQYYPQPQPYNNNGGVVGAIINSVTGGYGQYPQGNYGYGAGQPAHPGCAVRRRGRTAPQRRLCGQGYGGYNGNGYPQQQGYGYAANQGGARVVGITNVERRGNGGLRVTGVASSSAYANQAITRATTVAYAQQGYAPTQQADLRFTCKVNSRGQVTDVNINRRTACAIAATNRAIQCAATGR